MEQNGHNGSEEGHDPLEDDNLYNILTYIYLLIIVCMKEIKNTERNKKYL